MIFYWYIWSIRGSYKFCNSQLLKFQLSVLKCQYRSLRKVWKFHSSCFQHKGSSLHHHQFPLYMSLLMSGMHMAELYGQYVPFWSRSFLLFEIQALQVLRNIINLSSNVKNYNSHLISVIALIWLRIWITRKHFLLWQHLVTLFFNFFYRGDAQQSRLLQIADRCWAKQHNLWSSL